MSIFSISDYCFVFEQQILGCFDADVWQNSFCEPIVCQWVAPGRKPDEIFDMPLRMIVEIQVIDRVFLDVKKFMHLPYCVARGDFS